MNHNNAKFIVYSSMFSVMSLVLAFLGNITLFPIFPYLKFDLSDMPVFLSTLFSGIPCGITVLFVCSLIRCLLFSTSGIIGIIMRCSTIILIVFLGFSKNKPLIFKILTIVFGIIITIICKICLNYFFWINFFSISKDTIMPLMFTIIFPYNVAKIVCSLFLAVMINSKLKKYIKGAI